MRIPERPVAPPRAGFPIVATVAPVALAVIMWLATGSAYMLLFAALGPVIALSTLLDSRRGARKARVAADTQFAADADAALARIGVLHSEQRQASWARTPSVALIADTRMDGTSATLSRWQREAMPAVALGTGTVPSDIRIESGTAGGASGLDGSPDTADQTSVEELVLAAVGCRGAPVVASASGGIGLIGPVALTVPIARGLVLQLAHRMHPATLAIGECATDGWEWIRGLPHPAAGGASAGAEFVLVISAAATGESGMLSRAHGASREILIAVAASSGALPPGCETIVRVDAPQAASVLRSSGYKPGLQFQPELVSLSQARQVAFTLSAAAAELGLTGRTAQLPHHVNLDELVAGVEGTVTDRSAQSARPVGPIRSLRCPIGVGADGVVFVDLIEHGPHAIVGGTTGSGKSELLATWVVAMSAEFPASALTFLLVDFKGGATFDALSRLPHCVGLITDLNVREAQRALESLRAEIRCREEALRALGARDITAEHTGSLPRLVIVVDEFQAMLDAFPQLHSVFLDLAARGRSLGVHLILCTQRPAGVMRDALLANCSLRLSLRVNNRADSVAVLGTGDAADIEVVHTGRCIIAAGESAVLCQVAVTTQSQIDRIAAFRVDGNAPRRPWLDPLPASVEQRDLDDVESAQLPVSETALLLGLTDDPAHQRYSVATYDPVADGSLLVIGRHHSGRSSLVALLASQSGSALGCTAIAADAEAVWDALSAAVLTIESAQFGHRRHGAPTVLLFDDFDAVCASWSVEYQENALELLTDALRRGPGIGLYCVVTSEHVTPGMQRIRSLISSTLLLGVGNKAEHAAFGGPAELYDNAMPPGGGFWRGLRTQLLAQPRSALAASEARGSRERAGVAAHGDPFDMSGVAPIRLAERSHFVVVSGRPAATSAVLRASTPTGTSIIDVGAEGDRLRSRLTRDRTPDAIEVVDSGAESEILVGDLEAWQAQWPLFVSLRRHAFVVLDHCSLADYRFITRSRTLPPYLSPGRGHVWLLHPDGETERAVFA